MMGRRMAVTGVIGLLAGSGAKAGSIATVKDDAGFLVEYDVRGLKGMAANVPSVGQEIISAGVLTTIERSHRKEFVSSIEEIDGRRAGQSKKYLTLGLYGSLMLTVGGSEDQEVRMNASFTAIHLVRLSKFHGVDLPEVNTMTISQRLTGRLGEWLSDGGREAMRIRVTRV